MRTSIQGGWVVGYDGRGHTLIRNGSVGFEGDRIVHVGGRFDGAVDRRIDDLVRNMVVQGMDPRHARVDWDDIREKQREPAAQSVRAMLLLDAIARREPAEALHYV